MTRIIKEAGKVYQLSDNGIITEASAEDQQAQVVESPVQIGDRVRAEGRDGHVRAVISTMYGDSLAVEFDDGSVEEYTRESVEASVAPFAPTYASTVDIHKLTVDELREHFHAYNEMPSITEDELHTKVDLDTIIMIAENDQKDLAELQHTAAMHGDRYKRVSSARYKLSENIDSYGPVLGTSGNEDISWVESALEGMEVTETTDADLAATAIDLVGKLTNEQLSNEVSLKQSISFQQEYLGSEDDVEKQAKFTTFVNEAARDKLGRPVVKQASTDPEEDIDNFNASALFL